MIYLHHHLRWHWSYHRLPVRPRLRWRLESLKRRRRGREMCRRTCSGDMSVAHPLYTRHNGSLDSTHSPAMATTWLRTLLGRYPTKGRWSSLLLWSLFRMKGKLRKRSDGPCRSEYILGLLLSSLMMGDSFWQRYGRAAAVVRRCVKGRSRLLYLRRLPLLGLVGGRQ